MLARLLLPLVVAQLAACGADAALLERSSSSSGGSGGTTTAAVLELLRSPQLLAGARTYQQLMAHRHALSRGALARSLVNRGAALRLRRVMASLLDGIDTASSTRSNSTRRRVSIGVIGGSISWGHLVVRGTEDWFSLLSEWMRATFPHVDLVLRNGCVPATMSEYVSMCLDQFVDQQVDLVFVEYATNDGWHDGSVDSGPTRSFERLLRKLLMHVRMPAVVLVETLATDVRKLGLPFYATAEDHYGVLAQYYSLPWLSYRNAVWHGLMADVPGFRRSQIFPPDEERHPTPLGHRYIADMTIHLLQTAFLDGLLTPLGALEPRLMQLPPPMFPGNWQSANQVCIIGDALPRAVAANRGWTWTNEGTEAKPKWGFVTRQVGASLVLRVDTRAAGEGGASDGGGGGSGGVAANSSALQQQQQGQLSPSADVLLGPPPDMIVWVGVLKSWREMGSASIACLRGCVCAGVTVDGMHDQGTTQQVMAKLYTTQAAECVIEVKVLPWARGPSHKFKVTGLMVTRKVEYGDYGDYTHLALMDAMTGGA